MRNKIFRSTFFMALLVLAVSVLMIFNVLFHYFETQVFAELESEAAYITYGIRTDAQDFLRQFENVNKRITWIAQDGTVLVDTKADADRLENHLGRKEIREAMENGSGKSERYSDTLTEKTLYYAVRLENGTILRVSTTQTSVLVILFGLVRPILLVVVIALILSLFLSYRVSKAIIKPINTLDLDHPQRCEAYEELTPLLKKIAMQNQTIRQQIREAEKSREEFRLICENMSEGFLVIDREGTVLSHNRAALQLLGADDLADNHVLTLNRTKNFREVIQNALGGNRAENHMQIASRIYHLIATPVYQEQAIIGAVLVMIDVTEREKREQLRREFTSNVSHELKTPLTSISGFAEMMKAGGMPEETVVDFATSIYEEARRLISLVGDIMKISELDEGAPAQQTEPVELYGLCEEIVARLQPVAKKKEITLRLHGEPVEVIGTSKILDEMIYNLCDNAIQYNREGGTVDVELRRAQQRVQLTVRDTGIGIPQAEQARVFERFYRVDKSRSKSVGGTGLGLAIVKHGALYHRAELSLESTEGVGTAITLSFEAKPSE